MNFESELSRICQLFHCEEETHLLLTPYRLQDCDFYEWLNVFEYVTEIVGIPYNKTVQFFFKMVDEEVHLDVRRINPTVNFYEISYQETILIYHNYIYPLRNKIDLYRRRFSCRIQFEQETIEKFADILLKMYKNCCYNYRTGARVREQFIKGLRDEDIRTYLRSFSTMSFQHAVEEAIDFLREKTN